jgi:alpha-glucosidase
MQLTLPGLPIIYYGEEIGMTDVAISEKQSRDPFKRAGKSRDAQRTPMQWDGDSKSAGFTSEKPWLPISPAYQQINVETLSQDTTSIFNLYKRLIDFRLNSDTLKSGLYKPYRLGRNIFGYSRMLNDTTLLILLNYVAEPQQVDLKHITGSVKISTYMDMTDKKLRGRFKLRGNEGLLIEVKDD